MAANTPPGPNPPNRDPDPADSSIPPAEPLDLDVTDDELILDDEGAGAPPVGSTPGLQATNFDLSLPPAAAADPEAAVGEPVAPTGPAAGWYESSPRLPASVPPPDRPPSHSSLDLDLDLPQMARPEPTPPGSAADVDLPPTPRSGEEPSDIFSTARPPAGSDPLGTGGSDVLADPSRLADGSDLFAALPPMPPGGSNSGMGSSVFNQPGVGGSGSDVLDESRAGDTGQVEFGARPGGTPEATERHEADDEFVPTEPNISLPGESDAGMVSGFDRLEKGESDSDLFGDATVVDMNLLRDDGESAIDLHDPTSAAGEDLAGLSSIFSGGDGPAVSGSGDVTARPYPGSGTVPPASAAEPVEPPTPSSIFSGTDEHELLGGGTGHSSAIALGRGGDESDEPVEPSRDPSDLMDATLAVRPDIGDQTDYLDDEDAIGTTRTPRPVDEDSVFALPTGTTPDGPGVSDRLDEAVAAGGAAAKPAKPGKPAGVSLASKRPPAPPAKPARPSERRKGKAALVGALGVLLGAGLGAAGMYAAVGGGSPAETASRPNVPPPSANPGPGAAEQTLAAQQAELAKVQERVQSLAAELNTTRNTATKLSTENKTLADQRTKAAADADAARKELDARAKEAEAARTALTDAEAKFKAAADAVAGVVAKLKDAKLIDPKADPDTALKALPEAVKKAVVLGNEPKAEELAAALDEARKSRDEAEKRVKDAEAALAAAKSDAAKQVADAVKKAIEATQAELARLKAERTAEAKRYEERLAAQAEQFQSQLAAARAGAAVPVASLERASADRARRAYASGLEAYRARQYGTAEAWFAQAVKDDPADARYWYYSGLAKWSQGKVAEARQDFEAGAEWEARSRPGRRQVGDALLLVQGPARAALDAYRP